MSMRTCVVIPCYNHGAAIGNVLAGVARLGLDAIVVDDGSEPATAVDLCALVERQPRARLLRLQRNAGKGVAVMLGLREAAKLGFTHALQVDADGQHCVEDIPLFLEQGRRQPYAVVCGLPVFDGSAPRLRRYGRYLTHAWVWLETRSFAIGDSMCGFRLYPLAPTLALAERVTLARGMDFDIDVLVRLAWEGLPIINVPTRVRYPVGGISNFRMLRDNARISVTHARLFAESLLRRRGTRESPHWSRIAERGSALGLCIAGAAWRFCGPRVARIAVLPAVLWVFLTGREARRASRTYLARLGACSSRPVPAPSAWNVLRHMHSFADACVDKFAAWQGEFARTPINFVGESEFLRLRELNRGALFIGSHVGNLEMVRAFATLSGVAAITAVVYTEHARRFTAALQKANARFAENLLQISDLGPETAVLLKERVERGEILVIVGDRTPPAHNARCTRAAFLGHTAAFPQGPFILAHLLECPVYLFFCIKRAGSYSIYLERFADRVLLPPRARTAAIECHIQQYARRLEAYCSEAPLQWFNFFDFWHEPVGRS